MPNPWDEKWTLGDSLSKKGGQGYTYRAVCKVGSVAGVLKELRNNRSPTSRARMHREAANLQVLNTVHGAVVPKLLDHNTALHIDGKTKLYLVTEFIDGPTLQDFVSNHGPQSLEDAYTIVSQIAKTLRASHGEDILHRDLKPDNVILRNGLVREPVVIDYGLSFNAVDEDVTETEETFRNKFLDLPETNTPGGDRRDSRSDITALAAILYFLLTGHRVGHLTDSKNLPPHRREGFTVREFLTEDSRIGQLEAFLDRAMQPSVEERFQSLDEFEARLHTVLMITSLGSGDLKSLATQAYERLRLDDRKTQLGEMRQIVEPALLTANSIFSKINNEIKPLFIAGRPIKYQIVSSPYECLVQKYVRWDVHSPGGQLAGLCFTIACRGNECVLLHQERSDNQHPISGNWTELIWFDPNVPDIAEQIQTAFRDVLARLLSRIANAG